MKTTKTSRLARIFVTALVVCMIACFMLPASALAASETVNNTKYGVLQVNLVYTDDTNTPRNIAWGTGFLINDNTVITSHHVVNLSEEELGELAEALGKTVAEVKSRLSVTVTVTRDVAKACTILEQSYEMDFAVLRLSGSLQGKTPLMIRPSKDVKQAEVVYAIGFPDTSAALQSYNTYNSDDATITQGIVNKIGMGVNLYSGANTTYIQTSCNLDYGNSGGPMVDENGYVIGISQGTIGDEVTEYYNAVAIDQVVEVLDAVGIIYTPAPTGSQPVEQETEPPVVTEAPATEAPATEAPATLPELIIPDDVEEEEEDSSMMLILIIAGVAVVVIVVVVVVILAGGKKKTPAPAPMPVVPPVRPNTPPTNNGFAPPPTYPVQGAGETTVLGGGAGETTVLSRSSVNGGTLIRKRTGETVAINADQFVIGRERKSVNYCISDNSSVSRTHVRLSVRGGVTYLADLGAANGTFVNGVKVMPRQEVALKNGDKITLADEDLEFKN